VIIHSTPLMADWYIRYLICQIETHNIITMKVIQSGHQIKRQLIIFRRTCTPAILFWEYTYSGSSNFGHFGQIFWHILLPYSC